MSRPQLSWLPVRAVYSALEAGHPSLEDLLAQAYVLGLRYVDLHQGLLPSRAPEVLRQLCQRLTRHGLGVSAIACAPDFTHPEPQVREAHYHDMLAMVEVAHLLGAAGLRVTAGRAYPEVSREDGVIWCTELLARLADVAERAGVKLGLENHSRDRGWTHDDFALETDAFLEVFSRVQDSPLGISFDAANPLLTAADPLTILEAVQQRVWRVQVSDRFPGQHGHTAIGEGAVDLDAILRCLAAGGYQGFVSLGDYGPEGEAGLGRGLRFVRRKLAQWWR